MTSEIKAAFDKWQKAEENTGAWQHATDATYKKAEQKARRYYNVFYKLCKAAGLNATTTAYDLLGNEGANTLKLTH